LTGADYARSDAAGLTKAVHRFAYDPLGNRTGADDNGTTTRYAANALNQYTQVGDLAPTYDAGGNLAEMGEWRYQYDALNRLVSASNAETTAQFWYDSRNRVVARSYKVADTESPTLALNTYDDWNLIEERDATGAQTARYVHGAKTDEIVVIENAHGTCYPHRDALGSITLLTDKDGALAERYCYSVTGEVTAYAPEGTPLAASAVDNRWLFTGREYLPALGLYDYRNRIYSPQLARFLQTDPIRFHANDLNLYRYVNNNYTNLTDPYGKAWLNWDHENEKYQLGRDCSILEPDTIITRFIEDNVPAAHTFAVNHDDFVDFAVSHGFPDFMVNIPSMLPIYVISVFEEIICSIDKLISWLLKWF